MFLIKQLFYFHLLDMRLVIIANANTHRIIDPDINKPFGEFLLQVQGRLLSGSKKEGMSASRAGVLLSSNSPEISRYVVYPVSTV